MEKEDAVHEVMISKRKVKILHDFTVINEDQFRIISLFFRWLAKKIGLGDVSIS